MNSYLPNPSQLYELEHQRHQELIARAATERLVRNAATEQTPQRRPLSMLWQILRSDAGREQLAAGWHDQPTLVAPQS